LMIIVTMMTKKIPVMPDMVMKMMTMTIIIHRVLRGFTDLIMGLVFTIQFM
jgi:hypothetical protein